MITKLGKLHVIAGLSGIILIALVLFKMQPQDEPLSKIINVSEAKRAKVTVSSVLARLPTLSVDELGTALPPDARWSLTVWSDGPIENQIELLHNEPWIKFQNNSLFGFTGCSYFSAYYSAQNQHIVPWDLVHSSSICVTEPSQRLNSLILDIFNDPLKVTLEREGMALSQGIISLQYMADFLAERKDDSVEDAMYFAGWEAAIQQIDRSFIESGNEWHLIHWFEEGESRFIPREWRPSIRIHRDQLLIDGGCNRFNLDIEIETNRFVVAAANVGQHSCGARADPQEADFLQLLTDGPVLVASYGNLLYVKRGEVLLVFSVAKPVIMTSLDQGRWYYAGTMEGGHYDPPVEGADVSGELWVKSAKIFSGCRWVLAENRGTNSVYDRVERSGNARCTGELNIQEVKIARIFIHADNVRRVGERIEFSYDDVRMVFIFAR